MAATPAQLVAPQQVASSTATYYTSGVGVTTRIDSVSVTNPTASAATITLYVVASGGTAGDANTISKAHGVNAGQTWNCPDLIGKVLPAGSTLQAIASAATTLTLAVSGTQFT